ncbi:DNA (cytosine-5-)-methyltransferase [Bacillus cereus]|uniref:DNA (cytosine-5-)-methyltransferase n=1 Tax=Bacillus TaxID=1386 RepID=UPI0018F34388|nr:DNA (cytosine-5-)-methyltransferase [Bacillus cereus]MBJ7951395.1 DNA (cytosine-5-)-methyltransferase [Bacillus cereus]MBX9155615.1 DNA (cytosine-5-)-methyltransferase [Bacillus cereus]MDF9519538.1 DNA (cytosine-5-)-methyltransferase [Bacillus cereus]MDF9562859.1 DNA (cytosine-5-)-methyltransferase [Bacillus cereus]MDZ4452956.1 DNA (cytosine-5-)-methyltransferase [Bacillus cereus]
MTNNTFKYVSLFSGIGGFEQALNRLGGKCVMSSEIDKFANQAYEVLYGHKTVGDITKVMAGDVPNHDVLVGGFPCPTFSVAGERDGMEYQCTNCGHEHLITYEEYKNGVSCPMCKGITKPKDDRGLLFFEIARIAEAKQPRLLLLENVKGLISSAKGEVIRVIVETLNAIGYTVDFNVLNSKFFGVPQNRERIFVVGILNGKTEPWKIEGNNVVAKGKKRISAYDGVKTFNFEWPSQDTVTTRLRDILEGEVDERYYLSKDKTTKLIAQLEETKVERRANTEPHMIGHVDLKGHDAIKRVYSAEGVSPTLTTMGGGHREPKIAVLGHSGSGGQKGHIYDSEGLCSCLTATDYKQPKQIAVQEVRPVLTPDRIEKRQNGRRFKENDEPSFTLTAQDRHGVAIREATKQGYAIAEVGDSINVQFPNSKTRRGRVGKGVAQTLETSCNQATLTPSYRIRKLTPKECFRLQGFADSEFDKLVGAGISNSQLYKMAGNAVTVNVIEAIGTRLLKYLVHNEIGSRYVEVTEKGA